MIVILNNKCNLNKDEFKAYLKDISEKKTKIDLVLCPNFLNISEFKSDKIILGSQNVSAQNSGAFTGEISANILKSYNVKYCLVGHSERRKYQQENYHEINQKIKKLLESNITPILCIGETKEERDSKKYKEVIKEQLLSAIKDLSLENQKKIIIAYEPVWSIGTGLIPTNNQIEEIFSYIKSYIMTNKILYGGSVNETNVDTLKKINLIDGYLLGTLSLQEKKLKLFLNKIENLTN